MPKPEHPYLPLLETCRQYHAELVVVSKTRTVEELDVLYRLGQRVFAENKVQEILRKAPEMPRDITWHLIGHLQTNKVRAILPHIVCIQSLDRETLWETLQEEAKKNDTHIRCLLQIKIAAEETKFGWAFDALDMLLATGQHTRCPNVKIEGVMGMATLTENMGQVRTEMKLLKSYFDQLKAKYFSMDPAFKTISMGMSGDYRIALEEGSTMIRVGSLLFT